MPAGVITVLAGVLIGALVDLVWISDNTEALRGASARLFAMMDRSLAVGSLTAEDVFAVGLAIRTSRWWAQSPLDGIVLCLMAAFSACKSDEIEHFDPTKKFKLPSIHACLVQCN